MRTENSRQAHSWIYAGHLPVHQVFAKFIHGHPQNFSSAAVSGAHDSWQRKINLTEVNKKDCFSYNRIISSTKITVVGMLLSLIMKYMQVRSQPSKVSKIQCSCLHLHTHKNWFTYINYQCEHSISMQITNLLQSKLILLHVHIYPK